MSVIRLKRLIGEEPSEAILVHCKRQKLEADAEGEKPDERVFTFVGTVTRKDDGDVRFLEHIIREKVNPKKRLLDGVKKLKKEKKEISKINRFKLINSTRNIPNDVDEFSDACTSDALEADRLSSAYNIYDAEVDDCDVRLPTSEEQIMCNGIPMNVTSVPEFVYDLYYIEGTPMEEFMGQTVEIESFPFEDNLVSEMQESNEVERYYDEDDDSNDESNWRNEYPDEWEVEDQDKSDIYDVDDCIKKMANCLIDHDYDHQRSSSDEDGSVDEDDENRFGRAYAKFKAKTVKELKETESGDDEESEDEDC